MADPLLSSLCSICHINGPKYTCPRCSIQTCSLPCSRRHKLWSSCSGVRDPTVYKPLSQVATPSGIDHDYNFLHSIEHGVERSEKQIVEDRGLVQKEELRVARQGPDLRRKPRRHGGASEETSLQKLLKVMRISVIHAPKGMSRSVENKTNWSKHQKCINWQVEWIRTDTERLLGKAMGNKPLMEAYDEAFEEDRRRKLTDGEKKVEKKRKAEQVRHRSAKRVRFATRNDLDYTAIPRLQNPETSSWDVLMVSSSAVDTTQEESPGPVEHSPSANLSFYLFRPNTPSSFPKVLVPLNASKPLSNLLCRREVLEFPTIYIFEHGMALPEDFMLERQYLAAIGQAPMETSDADTSDTESSEADSDTSSSGSESSEGEVDDSHMKGG